MNHQPGQVVLSHHLFLSAYVDMLMDKLVQLRKETSSLPEAKLQSSQLEKSVPGTLTSTAKKVSKAEAIAAKKARFAKVMSKQAESSPTDGQPESPNPRITQKEVPKKRKAVRLQTGFCRSKGKK